VIKFIRLYTVKTPKFLKEMNYLAIFRNSFKASFRSILRNKLYSSINTIGLALSMVVGLLVISLYLELQEFDQFHSKSDRIYQITTKADEFGQGVRLNATSFLLVSDRIGSNFSGVEKVVSISKDFGFDAKYQDRGVPLSGMWVSPEFAEVFDFEVLHGDLKEALKAPYSLALTVSASEKTFG